MRSLGSLVLVASFIIGSCAPAGDADPPDGPDSAGAAGERVFVEVLGTDTMAIERVVTSEDGIEGTLVTRAPLTEVHTYRAELDDAGAITHMTGTIAVPAENAGARPDRSYTYAVRGDSADIVAVSGADTTRTTVALPEGAVPIPPRIPAPPSFLELAARGLAADAADAPLTFVDAYGGNPRASGLVRRGGDTVAILYFGSPLLIARSADGILQAVSGRETTARVEITSATTPLDVDALAADFAARDAAGTGIGVPSPADTARAVIAGSEISVAYSQPAARGRELWGGLVPHGEVWRTGANAATILSTSADIRIGDLAVPAGSYSLWSLFDANGGELIVNSQTGQWGTAYDESQDFGRVALEREDVAEPSERFTIGLDGDAAGGRLTLTWGDRTYFVPIRPG